MITRWFLPWPFSQWLTVKPTFSSNLHRIESGARLKANFTGDANEKKNFFFGLSLVIRFFFSFFRVARRILIGIPYTEQNQTEVKEWSPSMLVYMRERREKMSRKEKKKKMKKTNEAAILVSPTFTNRRIRKTTGRLHIIFFLNTTSFLFLYSLPCHLCPSFVRFSH